VVKSQEKPVFFHQISMRVSRILFFRFFGGSLGLFDTVVESHINLPAAPLK
jgi:hypothetical protein